MLPYAFLERAIFINQDTVASMYPFVSLGFEGRCGFRAMIRAHSSSHTSPAMRWDASCSDTRRAPKMADNSTVWRCGMFRKSANQSHDQRACNGLYHSECGGVCNCKMLQSNFNNPD
ncbi:hypothetical protein CesoFtcFv8_026074 [Champsocephalus esox]|uniref:Uncharacterized protein n=1 Tax=Champsocephalus esox TaxID=159716 RepID=A0AAN8B1L8_9TELE|nr:hypothetical protein CesoFtcFv8_026074 [Champsocephalus esox]